MFPDILADVALGLSTALLPNNLLYCAIGVTLGTLIGVIPGVGTLATMSLLIPITFYLDPTTALIMLAGIWYGTGYGGNIAAILLNLPGTPSHAVTCLDGYPMAQQGRGGVALLMTTVASFFGASVGIIIMMFFAPVIAVFAMEFGSTEYFSLMVLGLVAASVVSDGSAAKGLAMVLLGILLGVIGTDIYTGQQRYTFNILELMDGVSLVALAMGIFGVAEIISSVRTTRPIEFKKKITMRSMMPTRDDVRRSWMPMIRGSGIGSFFGILPGVGSTVACFMSYAVEKRLAKDPSRFGKGAIEGIMTVDSCTNASDQTAFIPTMSLGIPGSATMALFIGVLMVHGITPGPTMLTREPEMFWGLVMSFWIGNILLVILNIPMIGIWVRVLSVPYHILYPSIVMFICVSIYTINLSAFDVITVTFFGALGYAMRILRFPAAPLLLGYVLGPLMEEHFRRAMILSFGSFETFIARPLSASFLLVTVALLVWSAWSTYRMRISRQAGNR